jgi:hypothetical protein
MNCQQVADGELVEKYLSGRLESSLQDEFEIHILECPQCLALLETCEAAQADLARRAPAIRQMPAKPAAPWNWFTERRFVGWAGLAALLVVGVLLGVRSGVISVRHPGSAEVHPPAGGSHAESNWTSAYPEIAALSTEEQQRVENVLTSRTISLPAALADLDGQQGPLRGEGQQGEGFTVLEPVGEVVLGQEPLFRWQALPGAGSYSVSIYDLRLNQVQKSPPLRATEWQPSRPLARGQVFQWQVTANMKDGRTVISPGASNPQAKFRVLDQVKADDLEQFRKAHPDAHLVLGILGAQAGLIEMSRQELTQVPEGSRDYELAQQLLRSVREKR